MRIITISRQFGSGGRELGKRMADLLGCDYYDREIITALAEQEGMDPEEVHRTLASHGWHHYQLNYRNSFHQTLMRPWHGTDLMISQRKIIQEIAEAGNDCIIVGRDADVILHDYGPFRVYICADLQARLDRCMRFENKKPEAERLSEKEVLKNIRRIDRNRRRTREVLTGKRAGDMSMFDLTVNTTRWEIRDLAEAVAGFASRWFEEK